MGVPKGGFGSRIKGENYDLCKLGGFDGGMAGMFVGTDIATHTNRVLSQQKPPIILQIACGQSH
jgi:hypothetical protein